MKQTMNYLSIAALAVMGAIMDGCTKETPAAEEENIVTLTLSVGFSEDESTKALEIDYDKKTLEKYFSEGETIAVLYKSGSSTRKAFSNSLPLGYHSKSATFEVSLSSPDENSPIRIIYPTDMAKIVEPSTTIDDDDATIDYSALESQEGNLYVISSTLDLCTFDGALSGYELPTSATLTNRLAILAYTLYDGKGTPENKADDVNITGSVAKMTFSDGTNNYTVNGRDADSHIYVAIRPTDNANITITAGLYEKSLTGKTYAAGQFYNITNRMEKVKYFTINSSGDKVVFAPGNLQYQASTNTWRFAEHQWDYIGDNAGNKTSSKRQSQADWIDLFGWGTSGYNHGAQNYQPYSSQSQDAKYYAYNNPLCSLFDETGQADWGYTASSANLGGHNTWRTLKNSNNTDEDEWDYIFDSRTTGNTVNGTHDARYTQAIINTDGTQVHGIILFPDNYSAGTPEGVTWNKINSPSTWRTSCTKDGWAALDAAGCVFLPAAGYRQNTSVHYPSSYGYYWSSSCNNDSKAYYINFHSGTVKTQDYENKSTGCSVRLVCNVE